MITHALRPQVNTTDKPPVYFLGLPTILRATGETTNGGFGLVEQVMPAGFASPYHTHHLEDEAFYVLEGQMAFVCGDTWTFAGPGTYVFGPREIAHGFKVLGDTPARMLLLCTPGGFDQFVVEMSEPLPAPPDMQKLITVAAKYKVDLHGPLPDVPKAIAVQAVHNADNKRVNRRWFDAVNDRDWETEVAIRTPDFQAHMSGTRGPLDAAAWSEFMRTFTSAFPDWRIAMDACISEGDTVATRWSLTGTHRGDFLGIPATGRAVKFSGLELNRVVDGRIVEHWAMYDNIALLRQIGGTIA